jgi:hypothetical protein
MNLNQYSFMKNKPVNKEFLDDLDKAAAKHLVKLGVEKNWKDVYRRMKNRRKKRERST